MTERDFSRILEKLGKEINYRPLLYWIRNLIIEDIELNFAEEQTPDGEKWAPLKAPRRDKRHRGNPILIERRDLKTSVTIVGSENNINIVNKDSLEWGTDDPKAPTHQYGDPQRNISQREFMGIGQTLEDEIADTVASFVENKVMEIVGGWD